MKLSYSLIFLFLIDFGFAHLCHDPFRPQKHLVLVPEKEQISIEETGKFRIYLENTFDSTLNDVKLFVKSDVFDIEVEPSIIEKLVPGERTFFLVKLKLRKGFQPGNYSLKISVDARSAELRPSIQSMDIVVKKKIEPKEIKQEEPTVHIKEPTLPVEEVKSEKITPLIKQPDITVKETRYPQKVVETITEEEKEYPQEVGEIVVKVEKIPFWQRTYFYIVLILVLVGILIWRKIK